MAARVRSLVLPCAGLGTRFLPITKAVPKEMLPLVDRPTIAYIVAEAVAAGVEQVVLVTSRGKGALEDYFDRSPELERHLEATGKLDLLARVREAWNTATVVSVRQREILGLGHAVLTARSVIGDEPFAVMLGDEVMAGETPALGELVKVLEETGKSSVGLVPVPWEHTHRYGVCAGPEIGPNRLSVERMVEKPPQGTAPSNYAIVGRYVLTPDIWDILARTGKGSGGEVQLTDALAVQAAQGNMVGVLLQQTRFDTGNVLGYLQANLHLAWRQPELRAGVEALAREILELGRS